MNKTAEIFSDFEVYKYSRAPMMTKLIGASLFLHIVFITVIAVSPVLQDMLFVASFFSDKEFVDKAYKKTTIGEEIALVIDFKKDKFQYPEGYFVMSAEQPKIVEVPKPAPTQNNQVAKNNKAKKTKADKPAGAKDGAKDGTDVAANDGTKDVDATKDGEEKKADDTAQDAKPAIREYNKRPMKEFAVEVAKKQEAGAIDLKENFEVVITGELDKNGNLRAAKYKTVQGSKGMSVVAAQAVAAMNDSGILSNLSALNEGKKENSPLTFNIKRNASQWIIRLESEVESVDKANTVANGLNWIITIGEKSRRGKDEGTILKNMKVSAKGKRVTINCIIPAQIADPMIERQLVLAKQEVGK